MKKGYSKLTKNEYTLKGEGDRKERRGNKDFKKGGRQTGSRGWCLKKRGGGAGTPLLTMVLLSFVTIL